MTNLNIKITIPKTVTHVIYQSCIPFNLNILPESITHLVINNSVCHHWNFKKFINLKYLSIHTIDKVYELQLPPYLKYLFINKWSSSWALKDQKYIVPNTVKEVYISGDDIRIVKGEPNFNKAFEIDHGSVKGSIVS